MFAAIRTCAITLLLAGLIAPPVFAGDAAVVFMYHRFDEQQYPSTSIRSDQFRLHLEHLRKGGFNVIPLTELLAFLNGTADTLPEKAIVITIDDAYRSVYEVAFPLMTEYGYPFTVFVSTDPVDAGLGDYLTWDQIREMADHGASFANHGASHMSMVKRPEGEQETAWLQRVTTDIDNGMQRLEEELTDTHQLLRAVFAYPYGEYDTGSAERIRQLGYIAFGQQSGAVGRHSDTRALPRYPINEQYGNMEDFRVKAASGPLPVTRVEPWDPVTNDHLPEIILTIDETNARLEELACYLSGQGRVSVHWLENERRFSVTPRKALSEGHQRVNCTAPANTGGYLWFSHLWIVR